MLTIEIKSTGATAYAWIMDGKKWLATTRPENAELVKAAFEAMSGAHPNNSQLQSSKITITGD